MTDTNSVQACKGWQCLTRVPDNHEQAGWSEGYCPECLDEIARDEIRAERQKARNEVERPTPITLADEVGAMVHAFSDAERRERVRQLAQSVAALERQLAEANDRIEELKEDRYIIDQDCARWRNLSIMHAGQRNTLAEECRALLQSETVQKAWPLDGTKRAEKPSDTHSSATAIVKFRRLLAIHNALATLNPKQPA